MQQLSATEAYSLSVLSAACLAVLVNAWKSDGEPLFASLAISGIGFAFTYGLIRWTGHVFIRRGYKGKDLSKKNPIEIPESIGLICALVYLLAIVNFLPFAFKRDIVEVTNGAGKTDKVLEAQHIETGRFLHRFPLEKVRVPWSPMRKRANADLTEARILWLRLRYPCLNDNPGHIG